MALNGSKCRQNFCPKLSRPWQSVINATSAHDVRLLCASVDLSCLFVFIFSSYYFVSNVQPFSFCFAILEPIYLFPVQPFVFCFMCSSFIIFFYSLFIFYIYLLWSAHDLFHAFSLSSLFLIVGHYRLFSSCVHKALLIF